MTTAPIGAQAQTTGDKPTELDKVEVTGSRIRRVDTETSDTVFVLDRSQIQATGASTLGQLLQSIPSFGGTPYNGEVNNGGGTGQAYINLRGLGAKRTLVLLDGQRLNEVDANAIPANMIDYVHVLKQGAAAIYGTDAIGGVVNFITRKTFLGIESNVTGGQSAKGDAANGGMDVTWGGALGNGGTMIMGLNYNRNSPIKAGDRDASDKPTGLWFSDVSDNAWTSSRVPGGKFNGSGYTPVAANPPCPAVDPRYASVTGAPSYFSGITRIDGTTGDNAADYRRFCSNTGPGYSDRYNYQVENLALIPRESYSLFSMDTMPMADWISWHGRGYYTSTRAHGQLAAEPFDQVTIGGIYVGSTPTLSNQNFYSPFPNSITNFGKRSTDVGPRVETYITDATQLTTGFNGTFADSFRWDVDYNYGITQQTNTNYGFMDFSKVFQVLGPSSDAATCTTSPSGDTIPNCTPINVYGTAGNTLSALGTTTVFLSEYSEQDVTANVTNDGLFSLPGGAVGLSVGTEYRAITSDYIPDSQAAAFTLSEANGKGTSGKFNVREAYVEANLPVLGKLPGVEELTLNIGGRYSDYSSFGSKAAGKYALVYRPYADLMARVTYSDIYRAPNVTELFRGAAQSAPSYSDPCGSLTTAQLAAHPNACANVPALYSQPNTQSNGNIVGNPLLKPEEGNSLDLGLVFSPGFYSPLSVEVDYWHYKLEKAIDTISLNSILNACFNDETSSFCGTAPNGQPWFVRDAGGNVANSQLAYVNANQYTTNGIDTGIKLNYPSTPIGRVTFGIDTTYLLKYDVTLFDPASGIETDAASIAGKYDGEITGDVFPRFKALAFAFWSSGPFKASLQDRYVGSFKEGNVDFADAALIGNCTQAGGSFAGDSYDASTVDPTYIGTVTCLHKVKAVNYIDLAGTYAVSALDTDFTLGINDLFDEGSPSLYNAVLAGASLPVYDIRGRNYYGRVTIRFK